MKQVLKGQCRRWRFPRYGIAALVVILCAVEPQDAVGRAPVSGIQPKGGTGERLSRPPWLRTDPLVIVGNWDSMPLFRRRVGGTPRWQEEDYQREHSEEAVKKLKELGVTMAVIPFYKGFGLQAEREHIENSKRLASLCHRYGIKVGVYVGSTIAFETFLLEKPEAQDWFLPEFMGRPLFYPSQTFRRRVYFMHPGYREYMKEVLEIAINDIKADLIHFDNTSLQATPEAFFHPLAIENFRDFLRNKYSDEMLKQRLGFSDVSFVVPPAYASTPALINDPLAQEYADFRCQQLADFYAEMEDYIRRLNPAVAVDSNPHPGLSGKNTIWEHGIDYPRLLPHMDIVWTEEGNDASVTLQDRLISKIRTYKMASLLNNKVFTYTMDSPLEMAESMAYNRGCIGMVGGVLAGYEPAESTLRYVRFFLDHFQHYREVSTVADVAILHSFATMGFNSGSPHRSTFLFEQALIQAKVPFEVIFDQHLKDLSKYKVLVLANQEALSDEQLLRISEFVRKGGSLVATEHTSLYDEWRRRRRNLGLSELFGVELPPFQGLASLGFKEPDPILDISPVRSRVGAGRVVYVPEVQSLDASVSGLPANWQDLVAAVRWAAGDAFSMEVAAPLTVAAELVEQKELQKYIVHLLNYDVQRTPLVRDVQVKIRLPRGKTVRQISLLSPDEENLSIAGPLSKDGDLVSFAIPRLHTYAMAVIQYSEAVGE